MLYKVRRRDSTEAVVGATTGTVRRPQHPCWAASTRPGRSGRSAAVPPLRPDAVRELADRLTPAGPRHPWKGVRCTASWGSRTPLDVVLVEPVLVAGIRVDTALERGAWRHPVRFARLRLDVAVPDVPPFGAGAEPASG